MAKKEENNRKKIMMLAIGVGALGTGTYLYLNKDNNGTTADTNSNTGNTGSKSTTKVIKKTVKKLLPSKTTKSLPANSTSAATKTAAPANFNAKDLATLIHNGATSTNLAVVLSGLKQITNTSDYYLVDKEYEKLKWWGNKSIVTDLIDSFSSNSASQEAIRNEFRRIGLQQNTATGKWSLQGIPNYKDIITLSSTYVLDASGKKIPVKQNTILGELISAANGLTMFKGLDGKNYYVPTYTIGYSK